MSARDELYAALTQGVKHAQLRQHYIDAFRAEVLREAADAFVAEYQQWQREPRWRDGQGDSREPGVLHTIGGLRRMADQK